MDIKTNITRTRLFEPLKGERKGQRSVRMNKAYRLIYKIIKDRIHIELIEVNKHEY